MHWKTCFKTIVIMSTVTFSLRYIGKLNITGLITVILLSCSSGKDPYRHCNTPADSLMAVSLPHNTKSKIIEYPGFTVSFNPDYRIANYVAWELTADETDGENQRTNKFKKDPDVKHCPTPDDYRNSGYDRGHLAPAADFKWNAEAMQATHYMTNICPQDKELNRGAWNTVEKNCRNWARRDSAIIIIAGPVIDDNIHTYIGENHVAVPNQFFKVVLAPYSNPPRAIAFLMDNSYIKGGAQTTVTTIDEIERITGFDFFSVLPDDIEDKIESESHYQQWQKKSR